MNLLELMKNDKNFSEGELQVINYLLDNPTENLTISKLAEYTYTSNATIIRLCKKLGYNGYRSFHIDFVKEIESCKYVFESVDYDNPFDERENTNEIIRKITNLYKESADLLLHSINGKIIQEISGTIEDANRIYIYAIGDSMITARGFSNKLQKIGIYPIMANYNNEDIAASYNAKNKDCAIFISYGLRTSQYLNVFNILHKKNVTTIVITANESHYVARNATYKIIIPRKETDFTIATFYSQFAFEYICNILYSSVYKNNYKHNKELKNKIDAIRTK